MVSDGPGSGFFVARVAGFPVESSGARRLAYRIVLSQLAVTLLVALVLFLIAGSAAAGSAALGGGISTVASLYMVILVFRPAADAAPERMLRRMYLGEVLKFLVTAALFIAVIVTFEVSVPALFGGYVATLVVYWFALLAATPGST